MTSFGLNPDNVIQVVDDITGMTTRLHAKLRELDVAVNGYRQTNQGVTAERFGEAQTKWTSNIDGMERALLGGGNSLGDIVERYKRNDLSGAGLF
jgi:uncharacterized protein YukE